MTGKAILPLIAAGGAAVFLLTSRKSKPAPKSGNGSGSDKPENDDGTETDIVMSGIYSGWGWRVRKVTEAHFGDRYIGEVKSPKAEITWTPINGDGSSSPDKAKLLAIEDIVARVAFESQKVFDWEDARTVTEENLRDQFPNESPSLSIIHTGDIIKDGIKCYWATMSVLPPVETGAYVGMVVCPETGEAVTKIASSLKAINAAIARARD